MGTWEIFLYPIPVVLDQKFLAQFVGIQQKSGANEDAAFINPGSKNRVWN